MFRPIVMFLELFARAFAALHLQNPQAGFDFRSLQFTNWAVEMRKIHGCAVIRIQGCPGGKQECYLWATQPPRPPGPPATSNVSYIKFWEALLFGYISFLGFWWEQLSDSFLGGPSRCPQFFENFFFFQEKIRDFFCYSLIFLTGYQGQPFVQWNFY